MNWKAFAVISFAVPLSMLASCTTTRKPLNNEVKSETATRPKNASSAVPRWVAKPTPYRAAETIVTDLVHTRLKVSFDWQKQYLFGEATLTCRPYFYPQNTLVLDAVGFEIKSIYLASGKKLAYTYNGEKLIIDLDKTYNRTETYDVNIDYVAKPNEQISGGSEAITSDKGLFFINPLGEDKLKPRQIWTQGETQANSKWFPTIDAPNQKMTQEIYITVDKNFRTLSNGALIYSRNRPDGTRTDYWKQELPHSPYLTMMAIGEFAVVQDTWKNKNVDYYVEPNYKNAAKAIFGNTPEMLGFFSKKLGVEYPWVKYAQVVVRDYVSGAMENTSASLFGEFVQMNSRELLDRSWDDIIAHELFHQWFGDLVTTESWSNLPLNESFASYGEYLWAEYKLGRDEADLGLHDDLKSYLMEAYRKRVPLIRYHYENKEDMFDRHSYQKGARVLHLLRHQVGDDAFFAALQKYLTDNKFKTAEIANLRLAFEEVTGQDLMWFFDQWFMKPGHPELLAEQKYADGNLNLQIIQQQDSVYSPLYRLPVTVAVWVNGKRTDHTINVNRYRNVFNIPVAAKPELVLIDPEGLLLGSLNHEKTESELIYQFKHANNFVPKAQALTKLMDQVYKPEIAKVFEMALKDNFWRIREMGVYAYSPARLNKDPNETTSKKLNDPEFNQIKNAIQEVALKDPKTSVRVEAMATLSGYKTEAYEKIYLKALQDSSYAVIAAGINGLISLPEPGKYISKLKPLQKEENGSVVGALAAFYATHGNAAEYVWFEKQIEKLSPSELQYFLSGFAAYLYKMPNAEKLKGISKIAELARTHGDYKVRFGAYKALTILEDEPGVKEMLKDIKQKEKDPILLQLYNEAS